MEAHSLVRYSTSFSYFFVALHYSITSHDMVRIILRFCVQFQQLRLHSIQLLTTHQNVAIDTILQNIIYKNNKKLQGLQGPLGEDGGAYGNCVFGGPGGWGVKMVGHHITFTDMHDSWPIYLLYIWREIDPILIFIAQ